MTTKTVYLKGKANYIRPYHRDEGNDKTPSDILDKLQKTDGQYNTEFLLVNPDTDEVFTSRDDALDYLSSKGVPVDNMMGNLVKRNSETKEVRYKVTRPHFEPTMPNKDTGEQGVVFGPPKVVKFVKDENGDVVYDNNGKRKVEPWDEDVLIGNGSDITVKINVWKGDKATKIRWDAVRVDNLVEYERPEGDF